MASPGPRALTGRTLPLCGPLAPGAASPGGAVRYVIAPGPGQLAIADHAGP